MFGQNKPEAQWFIQNRTYVDDCMAGHDNLEELRRISGDLDNLVEQRGFKFKDIHMSGDSLEDSIPRKVLGTRSPTDCSSTSKSTSPGREKVQS
jgi:hypothetical protein